MLTFKPTTATLRIRELSRVLRDINYIDNGPKLFCVELVLSVDSQLTSGNFMCKQNVGYFNKNAVVYIPA